MPYYLHQFSYSREAVSAMVDTPSDRRAAAEAVFSAGGGRLVDLYFCFGEFDGIAISEFPSTVDGASVALAVSASGAFSRLQTTALITNDEAMQAMRKAGAIAAGYAPPTG